ncbi:MAG TPA: hypothetical protein VGL77_19900 [Armatimonadota bacterium]|jgi:tetratricopeptide (TPR) repeat protein
MISRIPRWLWIALGVVVLAAVVTGLVFLIRSNTGWVSIVGWTITGLLVAAVILFLSVSAPQLLKLYKLQKYYKANEAQLRMLPSLMQSGRTQEATMRFEGLMKNAPDNAYLYFMKAFFMRSAGKLPEALSAANKALALAKTDSSLPAMLQQVGGQMGQPTTVEGFKTQLEELKSLLEPRVNMMRERREKAVTKRNKKSR